MEWNALDFGLLFDLHYVDLSEHVVYLCHFGKYLAYSQIFFLKMMNFRVISRWSFIYLSIMTPQKPVWGGVVVHIAIWDEGRIYVIILFGYVQFWSHFSTKNTLQVKERGSVGEERLFIYTPCHEMLWILGFLWTRTMGTYLSMWFIYAILENT